MISAFELFKIGIGPSSSHTVGPMVAAAAFAERLTSDGVLGRVARVEVALFGSLAWTGKGHGTDKAVILGLAGERPRTVDPDRADALVAEVAAQRQLSSPVTASSASIPRPTSCSTARRPRPSTPIRSRCEPTRPTARSSPRSAGAPSAAASSPPKRMSAARRRRKRSRCPIPSATPAICSPWRKPRGLSIAGLVAANERARRPAAEVDEHLDGVIDTMMACVDRGIATSGELPGGLKVKRRARAIHQALIARNARTPHEIMDWVSLYAIAVNEENAAGGRVVTAPTNGAAGVVPATLALLPRPLPRRRPGGHAHLPARRHRASARCSR